MESIGSFARKEVKLFSVPCYLPEMREGNHRKDHKAFSNPALRRLQQGHRRKNRAIHSTVYADGSSLVSICTRAVGGHINKNSTSGANGVCKDCHGRWRAYINFRRKQYHLGSYNTVEEAVAARKEAESIIYAPYLKEHEGWEEELSRRLEELKKK
jgi:hypothetical protein